MRIPDEVLLEIKYKNPIEEIVAPYVQLKRAGRNLSGLCPFHSEKTPSFTVYPDTASYYCFGCGAGGDVFTFIRQMENLDYIEAVRKLAEQSGVVIPEGNYDDSYARLKSKILEINKETAKFYHAHLFFPAGKWALDYLTGRGLQVQTIRHFGLGAAPDSWDALLKHLKDKGFSIPDMEQANVITKGSKSYYDRFRNRVMFPIIDLRGNVIGFSGRRHPNEDKGGKYINTSDTPVYKKSKSIFGMNFAKNYCSERILVVEGNMDVVSLHQAGFQNTIAPLGTAFTDEQARQLKQYTKEIVLSFDSDAAGQKAATRAMEVLADSGLRVRVLSIPDGKDPDEFIKKNGGERFAALLDGAVTELEFKLFKAQEGLSMDTNDGKAQYLNRAAEVLSGISDTLTVDVYISRLSEQYSVSKMTLAKRVEELRTKRQRAKRKTEIREIIHPAYNKNALNPDKRLHPRAVLAEEQILSVLLLHPDLYTTLHDFDKQSFVSALNARLYTELLPLFEQNKPLELTLLGPRLTPEESAYLVSLQNRDIPISNPAGTLREAVTVLKEEQQTIKLAEPNSLSDDDWETQMKRIIEQKKEHKA